MEIELYTNYKDTSKIVGKAEVHFSDILLYPQNKIHTSVKIYSYENSRLVFIRLQIKIVS